MILFLDNHEASHASTLKKGDRMIVVRMLKEQPPDEYEFHHRDDSYVYFTEQIYIGGFGGYRQSLPWFIELRFPVGMELVGKETFREYYVYDHSKPRKKVIGGYWYKTNPPKNVMINWRSSITMPKEAVRIWIKAVENRVDKCKNITMNEATLMGVNGDPMRRYCPDDAAYYLEPYITKKHGKNAWEYYAEIATIEMTEKGD